MRGTGFGDEIAADLDMRAVQDGSVRGDALDHRDQAWHLGIIDLLDRISTGSNNQNLSVIIPYYNDVCSTLLWRP